MKIIKKGTPQPELWEATCRKCKSVMQAEPRELSITHCPRDGYGIAHERCLVCEEAVIFYKVRR